MQIKKLILLVVGLALLGLVIAACGAGDDTASAPCPTVPACPDCPECPEAPECPEPEACPEVPFEEMWAASGHADEEAEAFRHWDEDDPALVSSRCAKCHSAYGYLDFLGLDGTEAGTVENDAEPSVITCVACHNEATAAMDSVVFPSGMEVTGLGGEARCMQCHQGRESTVSVNNSIAEAAVEDDVISEDLGFRNVHYFAAAATLYGSEAQGGYQYEGQAYDGRFGHVEGYNTCADCHNSHTLELRVEECSQCHTGDPTDYRMAGSLADFDGDGDISEGISYEIAGLQEMLYMAIQTYGAEIAGTPIVYDAASHPYWFDEAGEGYASWTPRLLRAAYNYQVSVKDPGAFAHNANYIIQLLYDSIADLNTVISSPIDLSMAHRNDAGHFDGTAEAFRHWDEDGDVSGGCARCHSAAGLPLFIEQGAEIAQPVANGFSCLTCHTDYTFARYEVGAVEFPSGAELDTGNPDSNLCLNCHQGRESGSSVSEDIAGLEDDVVGEGLRFVNVHYFAAGATLFGGEAGGLYQYEGQEYAGRFAHVSGFDTCVSCHDAHALQVQVAACGGCHAGVESVEDLHAIRMSGEDYDGDGDTGEGIAGEVETYQEALYTAMQAYASDIVGTSIVYNSARYPYWFTEDGESYAAWTPRLLRAAYNYQYVVKDPGAFAHNGHYVIQVLYDTLMDLGEQVTVDMTGMVRP